MPWEQAREHAIVQASERVQVGRIDGIGAIAHQLRSAEFQMLCLDLIGHTRTLSNPCREKRLLLSTIESAIRTQGSSGSKVRKLFSS